MSRSHRLIRLIPHKPLGSAALTMFAVASLAVSFVGSVEAQSLSASDVDMGTIERKIELIDPKSGPPGTVVRVNTRDMPVITPVRVGLGAARVGFEAFQELMTGNEGDFDVTVTVPDWASWNRVHVFIVFDIYFRPIALSDAFHVTNEEGLVRRTGRVTHREDGCSILRDIDGVQYALGSDEVNVSDIEENTTVTLDARVVDEERCGFRNVLNVSSLGTD